MLLDFRKPQCFILDKVVSYSGKYFCFFGSHYEKGIPCWIVGSSNKKTGELVQRHYLSSKYVNEEHAKFEAETFWNQFKEGMKRRPESEETDEFTESIKPWLTKPGRA